MEVSSGGRKLPVEFFTVPAVASRQVHRQVVVGLKLGQQLVDILRTEVGRIAGAFTWLRRGRCTRLISRSTPRHQCHDLFSVVRRKADIADIAERVSRLWFQQ